MARDYVDGARLALRVLGGFEVCVGDRTVSLPANAQRVLGYLAVARAESRREVLAGHLWSWTNQAHFSLQYVEKLRQFVQLEPAEEGTQSRDTWISRCGNHRAVRGWCHRPEFPDVKSFPFAAHS